MAQTVLDFFDSLTAKALTQLGQDSRINLKKLKEQILIKRERFDNPNTRRFLLSMQQMPVVKSKQLNVDQAAITIDLPKDMNLTSPLAGLSPWRKGPFQFGQVSIDSEWQSNIKWDRFKHDMPDLKKRKVLDIGCGNGYYMFRMLSQHPAMVLGIDPSHLTMFEFQAANQYISDSTLNYLPIGWDSCDAFSGYFDVVFCLGILYHHRSPLDILKTIKITCKQGGVLCLDTLIMDGDYEVALFPKER